MNKTKWYKSVTKLESLEVGAKVAFGELPYASQWYKTNEGWQKLGSSYPAWSAKTTIHYENGKQFQVIDND